MTQESKQFESLLPMAIFLDTNVVWKLPEHEQWGLLPSFLSDAKSQGLKVYLPDIVAREWLQHRREKAAASVAKAAESGRHLSQYSKEWAQMKLPSSGYLDRTVETEERRRLQSLGLVLLDPPEFDIAALSNAAARKRAPFRDANKGFKDELIVLTMLEIIDKGDYKSVMLISKDKVFSEEAIKTRFLRYSAEFLCATTLEEAIELLEKSFDQAAQRARQQRTKEILKLAMEHWKEIFDAGITQVRVEGVPRYAYAKDDEIPAGSNVREILGITPTNISALFVGPTDNTGWTMLKLSVLCNLRLEIEPHVTSSFLGSRIYMDGERRYQRPVQLGPSQTEVERMIYLDARIKQDGKKWTEFSLLDPSKRMERMLRRLDMNDNGPQDAKT